MPVAKRDYYDVLGIDRSASVDEVKQAFRRLALKHHPDRNAANRREAEERFKEISEAYEVLSDSSKRASYDQYGHSGVEGTFRGGFDFGRDFHHFDDLADLFGGGLEDLLSSFGLGALFGAGAAGFGGRAGRRGGGVRGAPGADLEYVLELDLAEVLRTTEHGIRFRRRERCKACGGSGAKGAQGREACPECRGSGQRRFAQGFFTLATTCPRCAGEGEIVRDPCPDCRGEGRVSREGNLTVKVPAGVEDGMRLKLSGEGEGGVRSGGAGDLYIHIRIRPHEFFERDGVDLLCEVPIGVVEAALGGEIQVPTLTGEASVKIPAGTQPGQVLRLKGKGLPGLRGGGWGDQMIRLRVEVPTRLSAAQRKLLEDFRRLSDKGCFPKD